MTEASTPTVTRNDEKSRYEIHLDDVLAGYAEFEPDDHGRQVYAHTEIDPAFGGRGLGTTLVAAALADAAERGEIVVPVCPFVVRYLENTDVPGLAVVWRPTSDAAGSDDVDAPND
ncbi:N-acetyltransferase [Microbacterium sp. W1N]|uniref:GNAT family N-acetyltransferase n=1 Tax=Microbacterium festucae TaxID=2977531 RepID=UPI0021C10106|nr:GNAT family N-acetyltransferase [Microbacterium festucae]MCT9819269.1 N-acetyltransferase [Microbacterium festucae]